MGQDVAGDEHDILTSVPDDQVDLTIIVAHQAYLKVQARMETLTIDGFDFSDVRPLKLPAQQGWAYELGWFPKNQELAFAWLLKIGDTGGAERLLVGYCLNHKLARRRVVKWIAPPTPFSTDEGIATINTTPDP